MNDFLTVSEITGQIKFQLEESFDAINVIGEISNFKAHFSGHWYFTLKDENAQISCAMWKGLNSNVFFTPQDGMKVIVKGRITVYPPRGSYQIDVRSMKPAGEGELQAAFERLKRKLADEGLFDDEYKKSIPKFPEKIGIVTAIDGAALQDMMNIAERRFPLVELLVFPSKVQGEGAAESIVKGIEALNKVTGIDLLIVGRGGGSLEDLWAFNEEKVARAIYNSQIPIITGIGHEIDFTIADFAADLRAPTPSAAMEIATPSKDEIFAFISEFSYTSTNNILDVIDRKTDFVDQILKSYGFRLPVDLLNNRTQSLDNLIYRIQNNIESKWISFETNLNLFHNLIKSYSVDKILQKGFSIVRQNKKFIKRSKNLKPESEFSIKFFDNEITIN